MSESKKKYSLKLLFNSTQVSKEELQEKANNALQNFLPSNINLLVDKLHSKTLQLTLKGELEIIDECHDILNKRLIKAHQLKCKRLLDEVGDEIRRQAYPIISDIEQRFRVFINQALIEVSGFDWWDTTTSAELRSKVQQVYDNHQEDDTSLDPLECTQFDDLIKIITLETSEWSQSSNLKVSDLTELLLNCESITGLRDKIIKKTKKFSFWEDIFARYFTNKEGWEKTRRFLNFVIRERHKVMHHRPIRFGVIDALRKHREDLFALLDAARPQLSEKERSEAQQDIQNFTGEMWRSLAREAAQARLASPSNLTALSEVLQRAEAMNNPYETALLRELKRMQAEAMNNPYETALLRELKRMQNEG